MPDKTQNSLTMKKLLILLLGLFIITSSYSQVVNESTRRKFSTGIDIFTDIWQNTPEGLALSTINRGINIFGMYNYRFGSSNLSFAFGLGICSHNMYGNSIPEEINGETTFIKIPDSISYKKSKLVITYLDIPIEFRLKTKSKFRAAIGFKVGYLLNVHSKYKGDNFLGNNDKVKQKSTNVKYLELFRYGPTVRIGYRWFNITTYYSLSYLFKAGRGPDMYPISVGISLMPF